MKLLVPDILHKEAAHVSIACLLRTDSAASINRHNTITSGNTQLKENLYFELRTCLGKQMKLEKKIEHPSRAYILPSNRNNC